MSSTLSTLSTLKRLTLASALAACFALPAHAADPLTDAMQKAYAPYRAALFRTNSNAPAEAKQAIAQAMAAVDQIVAEYAAQPPAPYDRDPQVATTLGEIRAVYVKADAEVDGKQLGEAHETLEHARELFADLRHRNQIVVFSDHMNAYHAEMEKVLGDGPKLLAEHQGMLHLLAQAGTLEYLVARLHQEAPAEYAKSAEFADLLKSVDESVARFKQALLAQDAELAKTALGQLKAPYSKLFLKFG